MPKTILREIQMQQAQIESAIALKHPDCRDIHLEILYEEEGEEEEEDVDIKDHLNVDHEIKNAAQLDTDIDRLIKLDFMIPHNKKKVNRTDRTYPFLKPSEFKKNYEFINSELDHYYIDQNIYCDEDYRFEITKAEIEKSERIEDESEGDH